jgi:hypothetical protein
VSSAMELTTILANLARVEASWRVLCPYSSGFDGGGVAVGCPAVVSRPARGDRPRGPVRGTAAAMAMSPSPCVPTMSGVSAQYAAWRCSDGDGRTGLIATGMTTPAGPTSWSSPERPRGKHSRVPPAPLRGLDALVLQG